MRKFLTLAFVIALLFVWGSMVLAEVPADIQALLNKEASNVQLTPQEKLLVETYLTEQNLLQPPETDTQWGPDGWGYTAKDPASGGEAYNWIDIASTGTEIWTGVIADDDWFDAIPLPFTFPFYGTNYTTCDISANVIISFNAAHPSYSTAVPSSYLRIDPWVYDMYHVADTSKVFYQGFGDSLFVVSFINWRYYSSTYRTDPAYAKTLQVLMWSNGKIKFQYNSLNSIAASSPYASGIDDAGSYGLSVGNAFSDGLAITFYPPPIELASPGVSPASGIPTTPFNYSVNYRSYNGTAPSTKQVYIDGTPYTLTDPGGNYAAGVTMTYGPITLPRGVHNYYFYFIAGTDTAQSPGVGTWTGPTVYPPMVGSFDIGGGANDFPTVVAAADTLKISYMTGPVTFNIYTGTYYGQIELPVIAGNNSTNTITFQAVVGQSPVLKNTTGTGSTLGNIFRIIGADYLTIQGLELDSCHYAAIYDYYSPDSSNYNRFIGNYIHNAGYGGNYYSVYLYRATGCELIGNEISGDYYGIYNYYGIDNLFVNNMIYGTGYYGIYAYYGDYNEYYYNSLYTITQYGIYHYSSTSYVPSIFKNNICYQGGTTYAIYNGSSTVPPLASDYNNWYAPSGNVGYYGAARVTLAAWQTATGLDANSISADPGFVNVASDLHISTAALSPVDHAGTPIAGITTDFDGDTRNAATPDIGADEFFYSQDYCVELTPLSQSTRVVPNSAYNYVFTVGNCGSVNDVYDLSVTVTGEAWTHEIRNAGGTASIDSIAVSAGSSGTFRVRVIVPGTAVAGQVSTGMVVALSRYGSARNILADTSRTTTTAAMGGSYDIGGGANHYADLVLAATALQAYGMGASVTFNVYTGTYNGQVNLPGTIYGLGATNTLTIQNAAGQSPVISSTGHGFYLTGADYVTIRGLEITNCAYNGIYNYYSGSDSSKNNRYIANYIHSIGTGGSYAGIYLYYGADCEIRRNEIEGDYYGGIYLNYSHRNIVSNNMIYGSAMYYSMRIYYSNYNYIYYNSVYSTYIGTSYTMYNYYCLNNTIKDNIFYNGTTGYAIYHYTTVTAYPVVSDNNDLYAPLGNVGYYNGTACATLAAWQTATGLDMSSISADPLFMSYTDTPDLHITRILPSPVDSMATPLVGFTTDFDGEPRDALTPDIGADEFEYTALAYCVDMTPENLTAPLAAGDSADYIFSVFNCGALNDTYDITVSVTGEPWTHQIMDVTGTSVISSISVPESEIDTFLVRVWADVGGVLGDTSYAQIVVESQSTPRNIYSDTSWTASYISPVITIPYYWVEIAGTAGGPGTNTLINGDDQNLGPFPIGFGFPYYDCEYFSSLRVCSNGWASFTSTYTSYTNAAIPNTSEPNNLLAPYWDDLDCSIGGSIWYYYDATNNRFIVEWYQVPSHSSGGSYTFEIILYQNGAIDYMYNNVTHGLINSCTVGIENATGTVGVQATYNGSGPIEPVTGLGIRFLPVCQPEDYCVELTPATMGTIVDAGDSTDYTVTVGNCGALNDTYDLSVSVTGYAWRTEIWNSALTAQIDSIEVASQSSSTIKVRVVVPDTAQLGWTSTAEIVADSRYGTARNVLTDTSWATTTATVAVTLPYFENFDASNGGYASTACWEWGTPTYGPTSACSPPYCWGTVLDSTYPASACCYLNSPVINLSAPATLTFCHWYNTEGYFDGGNVKISTDGGTSWNLLIPEGGYPEVAIYTGNACIPGEQAYSISSGGWVTATFDLSAYTGYSVILRWSFGSDGSVQYDGWYVDDVAIEPVPDWCVDVEPEFQIGLILAGGSVDYPMTATNCGANTDVYDLSAANIPLGWSGTFYDAAGAVVIDSLGPLNNSQTANFIFRLTSPVGETPGTYTANALATSRYGTARNTLVDTVEVEAILCGIATLPFFEDFNRAGADPPCWTIVDGGSMINGSATWHPELEVSPDDYYMVSDADGEGSANTQDEQLITPHIDCSGVDVVFLRFWHLYSYYSTDVAVNVDISVSGGAWQNIATFIGVSTTGPEFFDITPWAANQSDIQVRWHYATAWGMWWIIDDVEIYEGEYWTDAGIACIRVTPTTTTTNDAAKLVPSALYDVYVTVENVGIDTVATNVTVNATDGFGWIASTTVLGMASQSCQEVMLPQIWSAMGAGIANTLTVTAIAAGDVTPGNNTLTKSVTVPGADGDTLRIDDGVGTSAWRFLDPVPNIIANQFTPTTYPAQVNWVAACIYGLAWPDATNDQFALGIWLEDPMNPGYPAEPPVWTEMNMYSSGASFAWTYSAPNIPVIISSGSLWVGFFEPLSCASIGNEGICVDAATNYLGQDWARLAGVWQLYNPYAGDNMIRANLTSSVPAVDDLTIQVIPPPPGTDLVTDVVLDWSAVSGAAEYKIYKASTAGGPYTLIDSTANTQYTDAGAVVGPWVSFYYVTADNVARDGVVAQAPSRVIGPVATDRSAHVPSVWDQRILNSGKPLTESADNAVQVRQATDTRKSNSKTR